MRNLGVYYKTIKLGSLSFDGENYLFNSNEKGVEKANKKGYTPFLYELDKDWVKQELPNSLQALVPTNEQTALMLLYEINETDNLFERLTKLASHDLSNNDLYVTIE